MQEGKQKFENIIKYFLSPLHLQAGNQMIQAIKLDHNFKNICRCISWSVTDYEQGISTLNKDFIQMKVNQKLAQQLSGSCTKSQKLSLSLQKMSQIEIRLDCLIQELEEKNNLINQKIIILSKNKNIANQDCQILSHQNNKLIKEIKLSQNQQDEKQKSKIEQSYQNYNSCDKLKQILTNYHCLPNGFPKNKNDAARLLNNLEVKIQNLEVQKLKFS